MADDTTAEQRSTRRKVREGIVVSTKMDKTVVVAVVDRVRHRRYGKTMQRTNHLYAHDEANEVKAGDRVLFGKWSGTEVKIDGEELLIMKESDIMGIIEGKSSSKKAA